MQGIPNGSLSVTFDDNWAYVYTCLSVYIFYTSFKESHDDSCLILIQRWLPPPVENIPKQIPFLEDVSPCALYSLRLYDTAYICR